MNKDEENKTNMQVQSEVKRRHAGEIYWANLLDVGPPTQSKGSVEGDGQAPYTNEWCLD